MNHQPMTEQELLWKIAKRVKEIRENKGIPQQDLAAQLEFDKSTMSRLESGKLNLRIGTLYKVSQALGITLSELVKVED